MTGYGTALLTALIAVLAVAAFYGVARVLAAQPDVLLAEPFLGGMGPREHAAARYHMRWYPVTVLFLAFDMEMLFMYPWVRVVAQVGAAAVIEMFVFLLLLLVGVGYAWREGALRWT